MYLIARDWGLAPSEFWDMTISEWFAEFEHRRPRQDGEYAGNLRQGDVDRLSALIDED